jgi:uncharacterized protein YbbK (DUF523 family)
MSNKHEGTSEGPRIRLGISTCLLGEPVRYDGGHKRDPFLVSSRPNPVPTIRRE